MIGKISAFVVGFIVGTFFGTVIGRWILNKLLEGLHVFIQSLNVAS